MLVVMQKIYILIRSQGLIGDYNELLAPENIPNINLQKESNAHGKYWGWLGYQNRKLLEWEIIACFRKGYKE